MFPSKSLRKGRTAEFHILKKNEAEPEHAQHEGSEYLLSDWIMTKVPCMSVACRS